MKQKLVVAGLTTMLGLTWGIGAASAHPVGDASEPNCHGQRVSHGNSKEHGKLSPVDRAAFFDISVREWHEGIRQCPSPDQPPPF